VYDNGFCPAQYSAWECYGEESGGDIFGRGSQSGVPQVWLVFDPLSGVIDDWDYANKLGTAFNISLSDDFFQGFVASGGAVLTNRGVYEIGGILVRVVVTAAGSPVVITVAGLGTAAYIG
jgi:hypothetical protein